MDGLHSGQFISTADSAGTRPKKWTRALGKSSDQNLSHYRVLRLHWQDLKANDLKQNCASAYAGTCQAHIRCTTALRIGASENVVIQRLKKTHFISGNLVQIRKFWLSVGHTCIGSMCCCRNVISSLFSSDQFLDSGARRPQRPKAWASCSWILAKFYKPQVLLNHTEMCQHAGHWWAVFTHILAKLCTKIGNLKFWGSSLFRRRPEYTSLGQWSQEHGINLILLLAARSNPTILMSTIFQKYFVSRWHFWGILQVKRDTLYM